jgi:glutamyl-tRNA reductase
LNHRTAPIDVRDRLAIVPADLPRALADVAERPDVLEVVLLSTCNRTEAWTVAKDAKTGASALYSCLSEFHEVPLEETRPHLYIHVGAEAIRHVFRVVSGLDSMVLGEPQIAGQVKEAFAAARNADTVGFLLDRLYQHALRTHKRVRSETQLGEGAVSVSYVAVELARKIFGDLSQRRVLVLGAGEMSELALQCLQSAGARTVHVANRTREKAVELAARHDGQVVDWDGFPAALAEADIVIGSTGAPHPVVRQDMVREAMTRRRNEALFLIDIATPRDVEPAVSDLYNVYLFNLDDLNSIAEENRRRRHAEADAAEQIVEAETEAFLQWHGTLDVKEVIVELRGAFEEMRQRELVWLKSKLGDVAEDDWKRVEQFATRLINKLLHGPVASLRESGPEDRQAGLADAIRRLFGLAKSKDEGRRQKDE